MGRKSYFNGINNMENIPFSNPFLNGDCETRNDRHLLHSVSYASNRISDDTTVEMNLSNDDEDIDNVSDDVTSHPNTIVLNNMPITRDIIRKCLISHLELASGKISLLNAIENHTILQENVIDTFHGANKIEISMCLLWAAFQRRWDLLKELLQLGARLRYCEPTYGLSALHLAAFSGCIPGTEFLLNQTETDVNAIYKCYSPLHCAAFGNSYETLSVLLNNGARLDDVTVKCQSFTGENALHCAVRVNSIECVRYLTAKGADVGQVEFSGKSPIHLAAELGYADCLRVLLETVGINPNARMKLKSMTALHLAALAGHANCIEVLLTKNANVNLENYRNETALHLAVKSQNYKCVERLLKSGHANPNATDCDQRTPLHLAVGRNAKNCQIIELLISYNSDLSAKDQYGYTPLHIAALNEHSNYVEMLISYGSDITAKSKQGMTALGMIRRKTPASIRMIKLKLDQAITMNQKSSSKEVELTLDFRLILQHCHPKEIRFLNTFVDEGQKEILLHPLCSAFLYLKWKKIRKYYLARIFFCFIFVLSLSLYVLTALAHNCYNRGKNMDDSDNIELCERKSIMGHMLRNNPFMIEMQWFVLVGITCWEIIRKVCGLTGYRTVRQYFSYPENIIEWVVIISVFVISFIYTGRTYTWQNHVGAFAVLFGWTNLMLMIGQLPIFGPYVAMYTKVQGEFAKLLLAYSCLLIGFTISFCVIFPDSSTFANPFIGLITVVVMMIGELNLDILVDDDPIDPPLVLEISAQVTFILFLLFITIILLNLLVGIAVDDIQGLQKTAGLSKLVRQTKLISYIELALFDGYLARYLKNVLHLTALVSPKTCRVILHVKPLNPNEKRLPKDILEAAYAVATRSSNIQYNSRNNYETKFNNSLETQVVYNKIDENCEKIESLTREIQELRNITENMNAIQKETTNLLTSFIKEKFA